MPRTVVCIPTYCEVDTIAATLRGVRQSMPDADVLVVDDSSPDGTVDAVKVVAEELGRIETLVNPSKDGLGSAYRRAFARVLEDGYEVVCEMDADLSHDPAVLPHLARAIDDGAALAIGSRYVPGGAIAHWPKHRRALSRYGNRYAKAMLRLQANDVTSGFRAYAAPALRAIEVDTTRATGYGFHIECAYRLKNEGLPVVEVPIVFVDRTQGRSKLSTAVAVEELLLVTLWGIRDRLRTRGAR